MEFYGPVREILADQAQECCGDASEGSAREGTRIRHRRIGMQQLGELLRPAPGRERVFENIVRFMAGRSPNECEPAQMTQPGTEKCIALVYEGVNAVAKIRDVLGPTDPTKAPPGSIRREFESNIVINAAHASDSAENAKREMRIVNVAENNFRQIIEGFYGRVS